MESWWSNNTKNILKWTNDHKDIRMFSLENILSLVILSTYRTNYNSLVFYKSNIHKSHSNGHVMSLMPKPTTNKEFFRPINFDVINLWSSIYLKDDENTYSKDSFRPLIFIKLLLVMFINSLAQSSQSTRSKSFVD